jgi:hypothetical protein
MHNKVWQHVGIIGTGYMQLNPSNKTHATIPDASNTKLWVFLCWRCCVPGSKWFYPLEEYSFAGMCS